MLMATPAKLWTVDEVRAIPDDGVDPTVALGAEVGA